MIVKRNLNRLIIAKLVEIVFVCAFVYISITLHQTLQNLQSVAYVPSMDRLNYTSLVVENPIHYLMFPMDNDVAMQKLEPTRLRIINESLTEEAYTLVLEISKNSTLDFHCLNISIDKEIFALQDLTKKEDSNNIYFILDEDSIIGSTKEYEIKLWMDAATGNEMQNKDLILSFELKKSTIKI